MPKGLFDWFPFVHRSVGLVCIQSGILQIHAMPTNPAQRYYWRRQPNIPGGIWFPGEPEMLPLYLERTGRNAYLDDRSDHVRSRFSLSKVTLPNLWQLAESVVPKKLTGAAEFEKTGSTRISLFCAFTSSVECPSQINRRESVGSKKAWRSGELTSGSGLLGVLSEGSLTKY